MVRLQTVIAVCLIIVGILFMMGPIFGFSSLAAERAVVASTASDADSYVGLESIDDSIDGRHDTATVARIHNNFGSEMALTTTVNEGPDLAIDTGFDSPVAAGDSTALTLECDGGGSSGTQNVTVIVEEATGTGIVVKGATMTVAVEYQCTGGGGRGGSSGPASFETDDVDADGPTQRFRFDATDLKNKDVATIDLSDAQQHAGVDYTGATATIVSGPDGRNFEFDDSTYEITYETGGGNKQILEIELTGFEITSDQGGTVYYSDDRDRSENDTFAVPAVVDNGGDVTTDGDVVITDGGTAGEINAGGSVQAGQDANVNGGIVAGGDVSMGSGSTANEIDAAGAVVVESANINGLVTAGGDVTLQSGSTANGVDAGGTVMIESSVSINDDITTNGDVVVGDGITLPDVNAGGTVYIGCDVNENGEIDAEEVVYEEC